MLSEIWSTDSSASPIERSSSPVAIVTSRSTGNFDRARPRPCRRDQGAGGQSGARSDDVIPACKIAAARPHEAHVTGHLNDDCPLALGRHIFLDHHPLGTVGQRGAGKDPHRLSRADQPAEARPGSRHPDHSQQSPGPRIVFPDRKTVHRRHRGARRFERGNHRSGEHPTGGVEKGNRFATKRRRGAGDDGPGIVQTDRRHRKPLRCRRGLRCRQNGGDGGIRTLGTSKPRTAV